MRFPKGTHHFGRVVASADGALLRGGLLADSRRPQPRQQAHDELAHLRSGGVGIVRLGDVEARLGERPGQLELVESPNGAAWTVRPSPNVGTENNGLSAVSCVSGASCLAAGYSGNFDATLAEQWNGTSWSVLASSDPGSGIDAFAGISCAKATPCVAAGYTGANEAGDQLQALAEVQSVAKPAIAGFSPSSGAVGAVVTITGTGLGEATVSFNSTVPGSPTTLPPRSRSPCRLVPRPGRFG